MSQVDGVVTIGGSALVDSVVTVSETLTIERWSFSKTSSLIFRKYSQIYSSILFLYFFKLET